MIRSSRKEEGGTHSVVAAERWSWSEALAAGRPGTVYQVTRILSSLARARLRDLGCREGDTLIFLGSRNGIVRFQVGRGLPLRLERGLAWFVQVEALAPIGMLAN